jgi:hypothetical protein
MRLSDAGLRRRQTNVLYPNHRLPPWPIEDAAARSLERIVRFHNTASLHQLIIIGSRITFRTSMWYLLRHAQ